MKATLAIEFIGADTYQWFKGMTRMYNGVVAGLGDYLIGGATPGSKPWAAEITGRDPKFKFSRKFINPNWDYSESNSKGSRGVKLWFTLESGKLYEISHRVSWKRTERFFATVTEDGDIKHLTDQEAQEWLSAL